MRIISLILTLIMSFTVTQCTSYDFARRIRQQGNLIPYTKIERLKVGMSKDDVAILMGNSLISPTFNNNRWDYAYTWRRGQGPIKIRNVVLYFSGNTLTRIEHRP